MRGTDVLIGEGKVPPYVNIIAQIWGNVKFGREGEMVGVGKFLGLKN